MVQPPPRSLLQWPRTRPCPRFPVRAGRFRVHSPVVGAGARCHGGLPACRTGGGAEDGDGSAHRALGGAPDGGRSVRRTVGGASDGGRSVRRTVGGAQHRTPAGRFSVRDAAAPLPLLAVVPFRPQDGRRCSGWRPFRPQDGWRCVAPHPSRTLQRPGRRGPSASSCGRPVPSAGRSAERPADVCARDGPAANRPADGRHF